MIRRLFVAAMTSGALLLASGAGSPVCAWQTFDVEHIYHMGDNDSRSEAVRMCYAEAERKALERAGVYMESRTEIANFSLERDEVYSFTAAVLQVERLSEEVLLEGQHMSVHCRSKVSFNTQDVLERLEQIARTPALRDELNASGRAVNDARQRVAEMAPPSDGYAPLPPRRDGQQATPPPPPPLRSFDDRDRERALQDLDALKRKREAVLRRNLQMSKAGRVAIARGMTPEQVHELMGPPQARREAPRGGHTYTCERYGSLWVVYQDEAAMCLRRQLQQRPAEGLCHCAGNADSFIWR